MKKNIYKKWSDLNKWERFQAKVLDLIKYDFNPYFRVVTYYRYRKIMRSVKK